MSQRFGEVMSKTAVTLFAALLCAVAGCTNAPSQGGSSDEDLLEGADTPAGEVGRVCRANGDCKSRACLYRPGADRGYCSKVCKSYGECPTFWTCDVFGEGRLGHCVAR
jgi:hypothetical protein